MSDGEYRVHSAGVQCECGVILREWVCPCGTNHGYTVQTWDGWARRVWPDHKH